PPAPGGVERRRGRRRARRVLPGPRHHPARRARGRAAPGRLPAPPHPRRGRAALARRLRLLTKENPPMRTKLAALSLTALLAVAACGGGGGAEPAAQGPQPLRMTIWTSNEAHLKLFKEIADDYRKQN